MGLGTRNSQLAIWLVATLFAFAVAQWWAASSRTETVPYSDVEAALADGRVASVVVGDRTIVARLREPDAHGVRELQANRVEPDVAALLARYHVPYSREYSSGWLQLLLSWIVPLLLLATFWLVLIPRLGAGRGTQGLLSIGKSRAKVLLERSTGVTFADVAGVDEAKRELQEVVEFLREPAKYGRLGARVPKGVLLVGPPGTGKTLLARALAGEAGVAFLSTNGAEFVEMFVGVGAARVRDLFEEAHRHAPAIIFIDELDALGRARGALGLGSVDEKEQTLNQLLAEMDGFDPSGGVIILGATNRPEILDPALLRAGRFDRHVLVDRPDRRGRLDVLRVHARKIVVDPRVDLDEVAAMTPGFAGADLANLVNEAALLATRRDAPAVAPEDFTAVFERIVAGLEKRSRVLSAREREIVAWHEMGHAIVAMSIPGAEPVRKISIIPRGVGALGYTLQQPVEDRFLMSRGELETKLATLLGGRAAELLRFGEPSTGAADDLAKATDLARSMIVRYGMNEALGLAVQGGGVSLLTGQPLPEERERVAEATTREADEAVRAALAAALETATSLLRRGRAALDAGAAQLLEHETLEPADLERLRTLLPSRTPPSPVAVTKRDSERAAVGSP